MNHLKNLADKLDAIIRVVAGLLLVIVACSMIIVIIGRYAGFGTAWADEVARIAFVWSACLGATLGIHRGLHFAVIQVSTVQNEIAKRTLELVSHLVMLVLCGVIASATSRSIPTAKFSILPALQISNAWFHSALLFFALLSMCLIVVKIILISGRPIATSKE